MIMTMLPGSVTRGCRDGHVGIHVGNGHRRAGLETGPFGGLFGQPAGAVADGLDDAGHFLVHHVFQPWVERLEVGFIREALALGPQGLVASGAGVARLHASQLPDDPVGGFQQPVGSGVDLRGFVQDLQALSRRTTRTRSCRRSGPATPVSSCGRWR